MSDQRPVSTDALVTIGTAPIPPESGRDAIHLAVEPVFAGETLMAGEKIYINFTDHTAWRYEKGYTTGKVHGIVDPFLTRPVNDGESFWCVLMPRTIDSLRHVWSHPDFPEPDAPQPPPPIHWVDRNLKEAKDWVVDYAASVGLTYTALMDAAKEYQRSLSREDGNIYSLTIGSALEGKSLPDEFWDHYETITGNPVANRDSFFSCAC